MPTSTPRTRTTSHVRERWRLSLEVIKGKKSLVHVCPDIGIPFLHCENIIAEIPNPGATVQELKGMTVTAATSPDPPC